MNVRELLVSVGFNINSTKFKNAEAKINSIKKGLSDLWNTSDKATSAADKGMKDVATSTAKASAEVHKANDRFSTLLDRFNSLAAFAGITLSLHSIQQGIDEWKVIAGQVNNVTASQKESVAAQKELYSIAQRTRQSYQSTSELFTSVARNANELGKSTGEILAFTEDVSRAMILGGGSQESQKAALIQLGQAIGSGVLRGEELNSIMEQAPRLAKAIAEGMGTTIGKLRQMGAEGKLTAVDVFNAIRKNSERLKMEMGQIPWTVDQAATKMSNAMGRFFYGIEQRTNVVGTLASGIAKMADYVENADIDTFVTGFKLLAIYAAAFFTISKWEAIVQSLRVLAVIMGLVSKSYQSAAISAAVFQAASIKASIAALLPFIKLAAIASLITGIILIIQDLYVWIQGGDSIIGRHFGSWESWIEKINKRFSDAKEQWGELIDWVVNGCIRFVNWLGEIFQKYNPVILAAKEWLQLMKDIFGWLGKALSKFDELQSKVTGVSISDRYFKSGNNSKALDMDNIFKVADGIRSNMNGTISNSGNITNNVSVQVTGHADPNAIGTAVADNLSGYGAYNFDLESTWLLTEDT